MAALAAVPAPSWSVWGSARGEVDRVTRRRVGRGGRGAARHGIPVQPDWQGATESPSE